MRRNIAQKRKYAYLCIVKRLIDCFRLVVRNYSFRFLVIGKKKVYNVDNIGRREAP